MGLHNMKELATSWICLRGWKITFDHISKDFVKGKFQYINCRSNSFTGIINDNLAIGFVVELPGNQTNPPYMFSFEGKFLTDTAITKLTLICCKTNLKTMKSRNVKLVFYKKDHIPEELLKYEY